MDNDQRDSPEDSSAPGSQFRQATDALDTLDTTYHRIRQLRQNLIHMTASMSPLTQPLPSSYGPGHGALLLTDDHPSTSGAARESGSRIRPQIFTALPSSEAQSGPSPRTQRRIPPRGSQGSAGFRRQATILPPLTPQDADMDPTVPFLPPDLHGETLQALNRMENTLSRMQSTRSHSLRDGSQTTIGRRVAARAAGAQQQLDADFAPLQQVTANISGSIEELQNRVYSLLTRVMERPLPNSRPTGSSPGDEERDQLRRLNPVRTNLSHRLSTLSNLPSARNLSTPTSIFSPDRPLLFEEPTSYVEDESSADGSSRSRRAVDRHYAVRRDGQQSAIPSSTMPPDPMSWMLPSDPTEHHHRPHTAGSFPQVFDPIPRLDLDGNEIPHSEDDSDDAPYELIVRSRSRRSDSGQTITGSTPGLVEPLNPLNPGDYQRMAAARIASMQAQLGQPALPTHPSTHDPTIIHRASFFPDSSAYATASSLVGSLVAHHSAELDEPGKPSFNSPQQLDFPTHRPSLFVNPLPMPISEMTPSAPDLRSDSSSKGRSHTLPSGGRHSLVCR